MLITVLVNDEGDYKTKDKQRRTIKIRSQKEIKKKVCVPLFSLNSFVCPMQK